MPEQLRTFAVQAIAQAQRAVYEGPRSTPWDRPGAQSLPPPDKPTKKRAVNHASGIGRSSRRTPEELKAVKQSIAEGTAQGLTNRQLADSLHISLDYVHALKCKMHAETKTEQLSTPAPTPVVVEHPQQRPRQTVARQPEPPRVHVPKWEARMSAYPFDGPPIPKCKPKAVKRAGKGLVVSQIKPLIRSAHAPTTPATINARPKRSPVCAINCASADPAQADQRARAAEQAKKARKTAELALFFAGDEVQALT